MASYLVVSGLVLIFLCLHGAQGRKLEGLKKERQLRSSLHHNDSTVTTIQKEELVSHTEGLLIDQKASQKNLLSKSGGYTKPFASNHPNDESPQSTKHFATYQSVPGEYHGAKAAINVWNLPDLKSDQQSSARIWVINVGDGSPGNANAIVVGWHVYPALYHDNYTHFFTLWTADGFQKTGCYNLDCPGFVLNNSPRLVPGIRLDPTSDFGGTQQYITLKIQKDLQTGDWLLFEGSGDAPNLIGNWPESLFTSLANSASRIDFGGYVAFTQFDNSPQMGSGHFPVEDEGKAASFKNIQYVDNKGDLKDPINGQQIAVADKEECYKVGAFRDSGSNGWEFYFGGPGGCNN